MLESITAADRAPPQSASIARGAGSATSVVLDLLCCLPALLVLAGRAVDPAPVNRPSIACRIAALLGVWVAASAIWADDKYAAAVNAAHLLAAFSLLWAAAQLVTTPLRLRLVAAVAFGLLVLYLVQAVQWRFFDLPETIRYFEAHKAEILAQHGWNENDFLARQYETKLLNRELLGFTSSANSFAAVLVLLMGVAAGLCIQRLRDGACFQAAILALILPATIWILCFTQSKAAFFTTILVALILLLAGSCGTFLRSRPRAGYALGAALVLLTAAGVVAYGLSFHSLPSASLNFRWRYWVAAWRLHADHPLLGVGWNNFGPHYLHYRLPQAAEEILDPHSFLLRFLTETGMIGLVLAVAWIARLWWELTAADEVTGDRLQVTDRSSSTGHSSPVTYHLSPVTCHVFLPWIIILAVAVNVPASVDFAQTWASVGRQLFDRSVLFTSLLGGAWIAAAGIGTRPAPWVLYGLLAALAAFLVHNLIEFSLFETGPMMLFSLLAGSALGMRSKTAVTTCPRAVAVLAVAVILWIAAGVVFIVPVVRAQALADQGDTYYSAQRYDLAAADYAAAAEWCPYNADYLYRQGLAVAYTSPSAAPEVVSLLKSAVVENPSGLGYRLALARMETRLGETADATVDFDKALDLDPTEVSIRLEYGDALLRLGLPADAAAQYESALKYNDLLPAEEPKRLDDATIQSRIAAAQQQINRR
jgi:hypothetical protein